MGTLTEEVYHVKSDKPLTAVAKAKTVPGGFGQFPSRVRTLGFWKSMGGVGRDVYPVLCDRARAENRFTFTASHSDIAKDIGCSTKHVQRAIRKLVGLGLLEEVERGRITSGKAVPSTYRLLVPTDYANVVLRGSGGPVDNTVHRLACPEASGQNDDGPVDGGAHHNSKEFKKGSRAAAASAAPAKDEGIQMLVDAGMSEERAARLPSRSIDYVSGMIIRMKQEGCGLEWLRAAIRHGDYDLPETHDGQSPRPRKWDVDSSFKDAWNQLSVEQRSNGLRGAEARFTEPGPKAHIERVIAGNEMPRQWLIDEVLKLSRANQR